MEASRRYEVGRCTLYRWLSSKEPVTKKRRTRERKIDKKRLLQRVKEYPDDRLVDHAKAFNVDISAIWYQFKSLGITRKKSTKIQGKKARTTYRIPTKIT